MKLISMIACLVSATAATIHTIDTSLLQRDTIGQSRGFDFLISWNMDTIMKGMRVDTTDSLPPGPPSWPTEWAATMTQMNLTTNQTGQFNLSYSISNNATLQHFLGGDGNGQDILIRQTDKTQQTFWPSMEGLQCQNEPISTALEPVPVQKFAQNGTILFLGELLWLYISPPLLYATEQTPYQPPKLFLNTETKLLNVWTNQQTLSSSAWPLTTFLKPCICGDASLEV